MPQCDDEQWNELIGDLYDAVLMPERMNHAVARFEALIGSDGCHLFAADHNLKPFLQVWTIEWAGEAVLDEYYRHYIQHDPRRLFASEQLVGKAYKCSQRFDQSYVNYSDFYQDWLIPAGARYVAGGNVLKRPDASGVAAFNRAVGRSDFNDQDMRLIGMYLPHLARTVSILADQHFRSLQHLGQDLAVEAQGLGVVVLDHAGRVLHVNEAGRRIAGDTALLRGGRLNATSAIQSWFDGALRTHRPQSMQLRGKSEQRAVALCWPAPSDERDAWLQRWLPGGGGHAACVVVIKPLGGAQTMGLPLLTQLFGLTVAEGRLAQAMAEGLSPEVCAERFNVSINTVRTQVRSLLAKTGCRRQIELTHLLAKLPVA